MNRGAAMGKRARMRRHRPGRIAGLLALLWAGMARSEPPTPMLGEGTRTLGVSGHMDNNRAGFGAGLEVAAGVFPMDLVETGAFGALAFRGSDYTHLALGGYGIVYVDRDMALAPFFGARLGLAYDSMPRKRHLYAELQGFGGVQYYFVSHAAVGAEVSGKVATQGVYNQGRHFLDWGLRIFTRWYY